MNAFTIDADNNITVHATKKAARQTGALTVFDSAESLAELIGQEQQTTGRNLERPDWRRTGEKVHQPVYCRKTHLRRGTKAHRARGSGARRL